ncbi:PREDICTED: gibberellic acid methyltransferase 2 [Camelina sativa]|uniref:Gibberellic acid methyltransferase 2 n=1 Tax=Camelina sativa TaxID=90675 RepID=A0ABM0V572_CAMSA|nr:PREDICTED: gibberellic acid methyltransferase 2 [Camelina sativa]
MESPSLPMTAKDWTTSSLHRVFAMQGGEDDLSYVNNSDSQALAITLSKPILISSLQSFKHVPDQTSPIKIVDLGCATGPNTFTTVDTVVETLQRRYTAVYGGGGSPEFEAFFCDLPSNDFNMLFKLLTEKQKADSLAKYFAGCVAGSFYDRLFPRGTIHVAVSLSALHWLSQIPGKVLEKGSRTWNKGKTWIEGAKKEVVEAYAEQSDKDLDDFLSCRKEEMVKGGVLFVLMGGRPAGTSSQFGDQDTRTKHPFTTTMEQAWQDLIDEGLIDEETRDGFNIPAYMRSPEEVAAGIDRCGGFKIEKMEFMKIIEHSDEKQEEWKKDPVSYGRARTNLVQAAIRPMVDAYLGPDLSHELFKRYENRVSTNREFLHITCFYGVVVLSAIRI